MKNILKKNRIFFLYLLCFTITGCGTGNGKEETTRQNIKRRDVFPDEVKLDLCYNVIQPDEAATGIENAYDWIKRGNTRLNDFELLIDTLSLLALRDSAVKAHAHSPCLGFVTGLKTVVALSNRDLKLLFMPVYMCRLTASSSIFSVSNAYDKLLVYEPGQFQPATRDQVGDTLQYQDSIKFHEPGGTTPRAFHYAQDSTGDTRAVMISFQEIFALMRQNENSKELKILNFAGRAKMAVGDSLIRQSVILAPDNVTLQMLKNTTDKSISLFGPFSSNYADRSNICPPRCSTLTFTVAQQGQDDCQH